MATSSSGGRGSGELSQADVTKNLKGVQFPAKKQDLVRHAQHEKADKTVLSQIQNLEDREYQSMADVMKGYGKERHETGKSSSSKSSRK
ncbi:DUF2795 domain-containing protein [Pelotalea chapellei]|uniref:DUF2795 domain-containing protein n=1 Tax=Pelotalea chapellei TaxID=44671 RepID=A0ABS5U539_9BACT|nr:DUF2795 domain-containing protein [Pelotalea chapellei]MBT1070769.1 DUF2795 domain-containing protein [Pelotalea chapellei]